MVKHLKEVINKTHLRIFIKIVWYKSGFCLDYVGEMLRGIEG